MTRQVLIVGGPNVRMCSTREGNSGTQLLGFRSFAHAFVDECIRAVPAMIATRQPPFWAESWRSQEQRKNSNNRSRKKRK